MKKYLSFLFLIISILVKGQATYNPSYTPLFTVASKPYAISQAAPVDGRTYKADSINFLWRPYNGTTEVLSYLNLSKYRTGQFPIVVNVGGTLNGNGTFTGGTIDLYWFRQGTADADLVRWYTDSSGLSGALLAVNNLSDVQSASTSRTNLGLDTMALLGSTSHGDISGFWPWITANSIQGHNLAYIQNYNNLSNLPTIPAQFNPIAGSNISLSGTYPNITFSAVTDALTFVRGLGSNINYLSPEYTPPSANPTSGGYDSVGIGTQTPIAELQVAGGRSLFDTIQIRNPYLNDTAQYLVSMNYDGTLSYQPITNLINIGAGQVAYGGTNGNVISNPKMTFTTVANTGLIVGLSSGVHSFMNLQGGIGAINGSATSQLIANSTYGELLLSTANGQQLIIPSLSASIPNNQTMTIPVAPQSDTLEYMGDTIPTNMRAKVTQYQLDTSKSNNNFWQLSALFLSPRFPADTVGGNTFMTANNSYYMARNAGNLGSVRLIGLTSSNSVAIPNTVTLTGGANVNATLKLMDNVYIGSTDASGFGNFSILGVDANNFARFFNNSSGEALAADSNGNLYATSIPKSFSTNLRFLMADTSISINGHKNELYTSYSVANLPFASNTLTFGQTVLNGDTSNNNVGIGKLPGFIPLAVKGQITSDTLAVSTRAVIDGTIIGNVAVGTTGVTTSAIKVSGIYNNVYGNINSLFITNAGSSYTTGTYSGVALTGGSGTGATANIIISGGIVTSATISAQGSNYLATDVLSVNAASVGGTGSGFTCVPATINNSVIFGGFIGTTFLPYEQLFSLTGNHVFGPSTASADSGFRHDVRGAIRSNTFIQSGDTTAQLAGSNSIVVVGNSITAGTGASQTYYRYANRIGAALNCNVINRGIGGTTAYPTSGTDSSLVNRLLNSSTYIVPNKTSSLQYLIFEYGTNDIVLKSATTAQYQGAIVAGIDTAIAHGWTTNRIILMSVGYWVDTSSYNITEQPLFAAALQVTATATGCLFVNNYQNMLWNGAANDLFSPSTYNVHPNDFGHQVWANGALAVISTRHGGDINVNGQLRANMVNIYPYQNYNQWTPALNIYDTAGLITASVRGSNSSQSLLFGYDAGYQSNNSATSNTMMGWASGLSNTSGSSNTYIGEAAGELGTTAAQNTYIGMQAGLTGNGANNTDIGTKAGNISYGSSNIFLGYKAAATWNTGGNNIIIGNSINPPTYNSANTLSIGNVLYGTAIGATADSTQSTTGRIGINTNSPAKTLDVNGSALIRTGTTLWGLSSATAPSSDSSLVVEAGVVKTKLVQLDTLEALTSNATNATTSSSPVFSFNMVNGHTYAIDCFLVVGNSSALGAASFNVSAASGSATGQVTTFGETTTASLFTNIQTSIGSGTTASFVALAGIGMVHIQGTISCTGTGSSTVGFAANGNGTTTVYASGSYCRFSQIN